MASFIIFDLNRTLYDPDRDALMPDALSVLERLRGLGICLVLVSRDERGRDGVVERFALAPFFSEVLFVNEKTPERFAEIIARYATPQETIVVGDYPDDEIRCGNACGAITVRLRSGKFRDAVAGAGAEATYGIDSLEDLLPIVERYRAGGV